MDKKDKKESRCASRSIRYFGNNISCVGSIQIGYVMSILLRLIRQKAMRMQVVLYEGRGVATNTLIPRVRVRDRAGTNDTGQEDT